MVEMTVCCYHVLGDQEGWMMCIDYFPYGECAHPLARTWAAADPEDVDLHGWIDETAGWQ